MEEGHRRSERLFGYDSNGRDYLASLIGLSREQLETWMMSKIVRPHLRLWHHVCVGSPRRFNDAIAWINSGEDGYYYNPEGLEVELLLLCRCPSGEANFKMTTTETSSWTTQKLWARAAWKIVDENRSEGQPFEKLAETHPAACFSFAIDLLCLAFHSIACRGQASVYELLINGGDADFKTTRTKRQDGEMAIQVDEVDVAKGREDTSSNEGSEIFPSSDMGIDDDTDATSEVANHHGEENDSSDDIVVTVKGTALT